jgi:hypothetical protein
MDDDATVAQHFDLVVARDERNRSGEGSEVPVRAGAEDCFEGVHVDGVVKGRDVFGGLSGRRRERLDDGVEERRFATPRVLRRRDWFGAVCKHGFVHTHR